MKLTKGQKIKVLRGALDLLGPNGKNWIKGSWYAVPGGGGKYRSTKPDAATCWCLDGALFESAYRCGFITSQERNDKNGAIARLTSLLSVIERKYYKLGHGGGRRHFDTVYDFNDDAKDFKRVKSVVEERLAELGAKP